MRFESLNGCIQGDKGAGPYPLADKFFLKKGHIFVKNFFFGKKWSFAHTDYNFFLLLPPLDSVLNTPLKTLTTEYFSEKYLFLYASNKIHQG